MLLLCSTSDVIKIVTDSAATIDVQASWIDLISSTVTPGRTNTNISSATTTTVVASPASGHTINVKRMSIFNKHATLSCTVTVQHYDGTNTVVLDQRVLGPGSLLLFTEDGGFFPANSGGPPTRPWYGVVNGAYGNGDPGDLMMNVQRAGNVAATPTNISTSVARCSAFMLPETLVCNRIRAFGVGVTTSIYRVALYRMSDLARLTAETAFSTAVDTWVSIGSALNVTLTKNVLYFIAVSVNATGTTAGLTCMGGTTAATTGRVNTTPGALPGSLAMPSAGALSSFQFQFAVTTGALPNPAATLAAPAAWTGGMPAFWLDSVDT